jgi:hypothetical protein
LSVISCRIENYNAIIISKGFVLVALTFTWLRCLSPKPKYPINKETYKKANVYYGVQNEISYIPAFKLNEVYIKAFNELYQCITYID